MVWIHIPNALHDTFPWRCCNAWSREHGIGVHNDQMSPINYIELTQSAK